MESTRYQPVFIQKQCCAYLDTLTPRGESSFLQGNPVRLTERHYAPWVASRQEQLERDVRASWADDPVVLNEMKGTPQVHGERDRFNRGLYDLEAVDGDADGVADFKRRPASRRFCSYHLPAPLVVGYSRSTTEGSRTPL